MNIIPFSEVRERFTDIAQKVQFEKQIFITKKNNKPAVGIVPIEYVHLLLDIFNKSKESKDIAELTSQYMISVKPEDFKKIQEMIENPPTPTKRMLDSARSAERVFGED